MDKKYSIEKNLQLLAAVGVVLFLVLEATLYFVQVSLNASADEVHGVTLPVQEGLIEFESAMGRSFERQSRVSGSGAAAELDAVRDRTAIEASLQNAEARLATALARLPSDKRASAEQSLSELGKARAAFLAADATLLASVDARHRSAESFARELSALESGLRGVIEGAQAVSGVLRLDVVLALRKVAAGDNAAAKELAIGDLRAQQDAVDELEQATLELAVAAEKVGLSPNIDSLNSLVANELNQTRARVRDRAEVSTELLARRSELLPRVEELSKKFASLSSRIGDESSATSLVSLRRAVLEEQKRAVGIRDQQATTAKTLLSEVAKLRAVAEGLAVDSKASAARTTQTARFAVGGVTVLGLLVMLVAGSRTRQSLADLRAQNEKLGKLSEELASVNQGLENLVAERTRDLQLVLDNAGDGFVTIDMAGAIAGAHSRAIVDWFGEPPKQGAQAAAYLFVDDPKMQSWFRMGLEQMEADLLPFELCADQMPSRISRGERSYAVSYRPILTGERLTHLLLIVSDITERMHAEQAERDAKEVQMVLANLLRDKSGFRDMVASSASLIESISSTMDVAEQKRDLHTLKGNSGVYGFGSVASTCHELENAIAGREEKGVPPELTGDELATLSAKWAEALARIDGVVSLEAQSNVEVLETELRALESNLRRRADYNELLQFVESFRFESSATVLGRLSAHATRIAKQVGKTVRVQADHRNVRLPAESLHDFWSNVIHALRNAIDHGIEPADERSRAGKDPAGLLHLKIDMVGGSLSFVLEDDGRGIDWDRVRQAAKKRGLPHDSESDLVDALFADGLSTRETASELSGRGVGMAALRLACTKQGGDISVVSKPGRGTRLTFHFPHVSIRPPLLPTVPPEDLALLRSRLESIVPAAAAAGLSSPMFASPRVPQDLLRS